MYGSKESENVEDIINEMKAQSYHYKNSKEYNWLISIFEERPNHMFLKSLCMFLANVADVKITNQYYLRKETCYFWIHKYYNEIQNYLSNHTITIELENSERIYLVPDAGFHINQIQPMTISNKCVVIKHCVKK